MNLQLVHFGDCLVLFFLFPGLASSMEDLLMCTVDWTKLAVTVRAVVFIDLTSAILGKQGLKFLGFFICQHIYLHMSLS